ncbi:MAG: hypothetical protein JWR35_2509 [Marmoricola sp.]|nr:hypothetical protein [Marmoricola sp.]
MHVYYIVIVLAVGAALLSQRSAASRDRGLGYLGGDTVDDLGGKSLSRWIFAVLAGLVLTFVAAFRWRVGTDYDTYALVYDRYKSVPWSDLRPLREPGINVIAKIGQFINDDYASMFAVAAVITVGLTVRTIYRNSTAFALSIALYILTSTWQGSFNGIRQYVACAILFAGHRYILERKFRKYLLVVLVASLFHISAIVMVLLYWVPRARLGIGRVVILLGLTVAAGAAYRYAGDIIDAIKQGDQSTGSYFARHVSRLRIVAAFGPSVFYALFTRKDRLDEAGFFYANVLFVNAAILLASSGSAYLARFAIYTGVYSALAIPRLFNMEDRRFVALATVVTVAIFGVFWYFDTTSTPSLENFHWINQR